VDIIEGEMRIERLEVTNGDNRVETEWRIAATVGNPAVKNLPVGVL
jgi:hypothetical protein